MRNRRRLRRGVGATLSALVAMSSAFAEQAAEKLERIEVTGSRLPTSSEVATSSPVAIIRAEDLRLDGYQNLELALNNFPQFSPDQGSRISNGASGTATANLRGLGAQRTLVLLNGKRMVAGSPTALSPDLNQVPPQLIQRVEILTGGASAVYGADAIAGVVNFILNDRFEGVQADAAFAFSNHQQKNAFMQGLLRERNLAIPGDKSMDGETGSASLTLGGNFAQDKGNAVVSFRYLKSEALLQSERDYSACALGPDRRTGRAICGGSSAGEPGLFFDLGYFKANPEIDPLDERALTLDRPSGRVRDFAPPGDLYNFAPLNYYQRPQERYGFNAFINYEVTRDARVYAEFGYHDDRSVAQIAPSAFFFVPTQVRWENPFLNDDWRANLIFRDANGNVATGPGTVANMELSRRNVEGGGRQDSVRHTSYRNVIGLRGSAGHWDYDAFVQASGVNFSQKHSNDFSISRASFALDVVRDPVTGAPVCASALSGAAPNCVPYNMWSLDSITPEALAYVQVPALQRSAITQNVIGATASANLGDFGIRVPGSRAGPEVAFGIERRTEDLDSVPDPVFAELLGQGRPITPLKGGFEVKEIFGELRVPVLDLGTVNASYRWSDYDTGVKTDTFGVGFNFAPWKSVRVRGSAQRAVRAPNVVELFDTQFQTFYGLDPGDPCAGPNPTRSLADCQRTGVTAERYGRIFDSPFAEYPMTAGGNPQLQPETARTYTLGMVLTPFRDFSATIDYFDVRLEDAIVTEFDGGVIFQQCLDTGNPLYCDLVRRDPTTQSLWLGSANVIAINRNVGSTRVSGADIALNYRIKLPKGHNVAFDMLGTYLRSQSFQAFVDGPTSQCEGLFQSDCTVVPLPKWRHRFRATWQPPWNFEVAATWRYVGSTKSSGIFDGIRPVEVFTLAAMNYLDLAGSWSVTKRVTLRAGVNNVTDRDPPMAAGVGFAINGNTFSQMYDSLGRHVFTSATIRF